MANLEDSDWVYHAQEKDIVFKRRGDRRGTPLICVDEIAKKLPLRLKYNPADFSLTIVKGANEVKIWTHSTTIKGSLKVAGKKLDYESRLSIKPTFIGANLCLPIEFGDRILRPVLESFPPDSLPPLLPTTVTEVDVVIDPGHGGNDFGAHRRISKVQHFKEKDFVLQIAKDLRTALQAAGITARLTREGDHFLTLPERAEIANQSRAKFFISLHMNSSPNRKARGYEIFVLSLDQSDSTGRAAVARENQFIPADLPNWLEKAIADLRAEANLESSLKWAQALNSSIKGILPAAASKNIRMGPFYLLYGSGIPAVLLELAYLTNEKDRAAILDPRQRMKLADALAKSIANQLKDVHKTQ